MRLAANIFLALSLFAAAAAAAPAQTTSGLPDVVGFRPGMSAQDAYNALKAHSKGAKVGIGQLAIPGYDKPVVTLMSVEVMAASPGEIITVWLTLPPARQVVWAISRRLTFEQGKEPLKSAVFDSLRQKYGPETDPQFHAWAFDEQGAPAPNAGPKGNGCMHVNQLNLTPPDKPSDPIGGTPLIYQPGPANPCSKTITIRTEIQNTGSSTTNELAGGITVFLQDTAIARQSQESYQAYLRNAGNQQQQQEINHARQQSTAVY